MILVTVGAQMPFDRMVKAVDDWAGARARTDVFAQVGDTPWRPKHIRWQAFLEPPEFRRLMQDARAVVAHAGMGSILTALELGKPILVMPRRGDLRETRNDHQVATAQRFRALGRVSVAMDERELPCRLDELDLLTASERIRPHASEQLLSVLRGFIAGGANPIEAQANQGQDRGRRDAA